MSIKKLFDQNKKAQSMGQYLRNSAVGSLSGGMESAAHLSESIRTRDEFVPPLDYGNPEEFAKYGSAEKYYENSFNYILQNYPYDGSGFEKTKFYNDLNPLEKYIFDERYPKSTGFVNIGTNYGTATSGGFSYFSASKTEFIQVKGGPHSGTVFSTNFRQNNLEFGGPSGSTVEFFLSKSAIPGGGEIVTTQSPIQVIFDLWNGVSTGSVYADETNGCYGNLRIELSKSLEDRFLVTMLSGTTGYVTQSIPTTGGVGNYITGSGFNHFAFVFNTSESSPTIDFYINGVCHETGIEPAGHQAGQISLVTGSLIGNIGALRNTPSGTQKLDAVTPLEGYGKLSASLDEFRFWRKARTGEDIGRYWFSHVNGGSDVEDANVGLGVYYKFNEGISGTGSVDNVVLDYSGRISNGTWTGYQAGARDTGSAITLQSLTQSVSYRTEPEDIIVIPSASALTTRRDELKNIGAQYDRENSANILNTFPDWIVDQDDDGELKNITQIISNYFDTLHAQVSALTSIKDMNYLSGSTTGSINEFPHNDRLVDDLGMVAPELFENASLLAQFLKRDEDINFQHNLESIKNTIYKNIYNNLQNIFKSKGNEKAFRNLIRCFGIDEDVLHLGIYSDNTEFKLDTNYRVDTSNKKYADFSGLLNDSSSEASIYQYPNTGLPESVGLISGSSGSLTLFDFGFTAQCEFIFPKKDQLRAAIDRDGGSVVTSSLFGWHTPKNNSLTATDTTTMVSPYDAGFHVVAIKSASLMPEIRSPNYQVKDAFFKVLDSQGSVVLTSSVFRNVYDNQKWNIALSVHPKRFPFAQNSGANANVHDGYDIDFYAVNYDSGIRQESFFQTASLTFKSGSDIVSAPKRYYVGAHRTNFTGTVLTSSDVRASSFRYWTDVLSTGTIDMHARSVDNYGRFNSGRAAYEPTKNSNAGIYVPEIETLALHWDFADVTGSDSSGRFNVNDFSSGSFKGTPASAIDAIDMAGYQAAADPGSKFNVTIPETAGGSGQQITVKFDITARSYGAGTDVAATAVNAIDMNGYQATSDPNSKFSITIPTAAGGSNTQITFKFDTTAMGGSGNKATATNAIDMDGYQAAGDPGSKINITIPTSAGGSNTQITIKFDISSAGSPSSAGSNHITIGTAGSDDASNAALVIKAINGTTDSRITYGNASGDGSAGTGVQGITASAGATKKVTLTIDDAGTAGNISSAIALGGGTVSLVDVTDFTGGLNASPTSAGEDHITIGTAGSDDATNAALVIKGINGTTDSRITYGNTSGDGSSGTGVQGITAAAGGTSTKVTLTNSTKGTAGNITSAIAHVAGAVNVVDVTDFTGGLDTTPTSAGANNLTIGTAGSDDAANAALVVKAINGLTDDRITFGNESGDGSSGVGIQGITAKEGSTNKKITLTNNRPGFEGNLTSAIALGGGTVSLVDVNNFTGGALNRAGLYAESPVFINQAQHTGRGDFFPTSSKPIRKELVYTDKMELPEYAVSSDMVQIKSVDDEAFAPLMRPERLFYAVEKSMYRSVSERMLHLFASTEELNNIIGDPVNRYRPNYKAMEKLRQIFFSKVGNIPDLQKYIDYYKWIDSSIGQMIDQLYPASAKFSPGIRTMIESHLLERSKFNYTFMGNRKKSFRQSRVGANAADVITNFEPPNENDPGGGAGTPPPGARANQTNDSRINNENHEGTNEEPVGYDNAHAPPPNSPLPENENVFWWMTRAERTTPPISQSDPGVMASREAIFKQAQTFYLSNRLVRISGLVPKSSRPTNNGIGNRKSTATEAGNANVKFGAIQAEQDTKDEFIPNLKITKKLSASVDGNDLQAKLVVPFTPVSSTVNSGYQKALQDAGLTNIDLTNLHSRPLAAQSPFTRQHVGGQQARSIPAGAQLTPSNNVRKESFNLEIADGAGTFTTTDGTDTPSGKYKRGVGAASPVNISNIQTSTGTISPVGGISVIGNYTKNYEIAHITDRAATNIDFAFNNESYFNSELTSGSMPTAFLTSISRRSDNLTGSLDYTAPKQRNDVKINKTVIVDRFAAPGSKLDSTQIFRDVPSDQFSPNNALPFRNIKVRQRYNTLLKRHTGFGGFQTSSLESLLNRFDSIDLGDFNAGIVTPSGAFPAVHGDDLSIATASIIAVHKTQRNGILRPQLVSGNLNSPLVEIMTTGSVKDNAFVTRPIPAGDRYSWFMALSHSQATPGDHPGQNVGDNFHNFILSSSRFPANITLYTSSLAFAEQHRLYPGTAITASKGLFSNSAGQVQYIWESNGAGSWVPWSQTRFGQYTAKGKFNAKQNFYLVDTPLITLKAEKVDTLTGKKLITTEQGETFKDFQKSTVLDNDKALLVAPIAGNTLIHHIAKRYKEPPLTSRYKPVLHQIKTKRGTAALTEQKSVDVTVKYSYGNELQGFANRGLNIDLGNKQGFKLGIIKRPYEILRDTFVNDVDPSVDGVEMIKLMSYKETIYPKEIYTYLSASRGRNFYRNMFWRADKTTGSLQQLMIRNINTLEKLIDDANIEDFNNSWERRADDRQLEGRGYSSSFNYFVRMDEQFPVANFQSNTSGNVGWDPPLKVTPYIGGDGSRNPGTGSVWPLDSFYYAEFSGVLPKTIYSGTAVGTNLLFAMASTMPAGELMMPHYGIVMSGSHANSGSETGGIRFNTSSLNSPQYVYTVPTEIIRTTDIATQKAKFIAEANAVGGPVTRPAWTAARKRRIVDGPKRRVIAPARFPWYDSYEKWSSEVRNAGKDYTIIPEYRISELMPTYKELGNFGAVLSGALQLTGATNDTGTQGPFNSADREFLPRYATTDVAEYLKTFMAKDSKDAEFNKDPRHLELKSDAILKLLPYEGFYPVLRTLELATLFSQSYGRAIEFSGEGYTLGAPNWKDINLGVGDALNKAPRAFRAISRPFFAPGIVYNSIKAGVAVQYPIMRKGMGALRSGSIQDPLHGHLSASAFFSVKDGRLDSSGSSVTAITLPGGRRRRQEGAADNFDFFRLAKAEEEEVPEQLKIGDRGAPHDMFYSDVVPFEAIFKPMEHISKDKRAVVLADVNPVLYQEITASVPTTGAVVTYVSEGEGGAVEVTEFIKADDELYRLGMSNFMANIPRFFLKKQKDGGFMSKFVAEIPARAPADSPAGAAPAQQNEARTVSVSKDKAYIMEIGMKQTDRHMMYSNPAAFGPATATGSFDWSEMLAAGPSANMDFSEIEYGARATASLIIGGFDENVLDGKFIGLTGSNSADATVTVTFTFNKSVAPSSPAKVDANNYTIGCQSVTDAPAVGGAIFNALVLANTNGDYKNLSTFNSVTGDVNLVQRLRTNKFNGNENVGTAITPSVLQAPGPYAGGLLAPLFTVATTEQTGGVPQGRDWPYHRAEFAPFTPTYFYGPSVVRVTYVPRQSGEVTLAQILSGEDLFVEYNNENGYYYDFDSGSFIGANDLVLSLDGFPAYGFNRAWQNRQDLDSSVVIDNVYPTDAADVSPRDKNKWVIMPKWECPMLDFPLSDGTYEFSSSVNPGEHDPKVTGMWHQYGTMPSSSAEGVFMYISDVSVDSTELRLLGNPTGSGATRADGLAPAGIALSGTAKVEVVRKIPKFVLDSNREIDSLAKLVGFKDEDIQAPGTFQPEKARRLGQLAENGEKTISEAILAMPYYLEPKTQQMKVMTLKGNMSSLGPKVKEFRRNFTKYSFPPPLKKQLTSLLPPNFPKVATFINPFGGDDYDQILPGEEDVSMPIVYLMEHTVALSRQDLADIWQGVMPDIAATMKTSVSAIDHYMPGDSVSGAGKKTVFPELLLKELELGLPRNGHPRVDLIDIAEIGARDGFIPEIKWMIFKVKERGVDSFSRFVSEEVNGGPSSFSYDNVFGVIADNLPQEQKDFLRSKKAEYTKGLYVSDDMGVAGNTYNWPYDYCSLIELGKLSVNVGFRPELDREVEEISEDEEKNARSRGQRQQKEAEAMRQQERKLSDPNPRAVSAPQGFGPPPTGERPPPIPPEFPPGFDPQAVPPAQAEPFNIGVEDEFAAQQMGQMNIPEDIPRDQIPEQMRNMTPEQMRNMTPQDLQQRGIPAPNRGPVNAPRTMGSIPTGFTPPGGGNTGGGNTGGGGAGGGGGY